MNFINPISVLVTITFIMGLLFLNKKRTNALELFLTLMFSFCLELICVFFLNHKKNINLLYSVGFILHFYFWLGIICNVFKISKQKKNILSIFLLFCLINLIFIEKLNLNYLTFIFGSLLYILIFLIECSKKLKNEELVLFSSNNFILIIAPILFFIGFTFIFGFRNSTLRFFKVYNQIDFYTVICYFVNIIYYFLINLYIYKEYKLKNAN